MDASARSAPSATPRPTVQETLNHEVSFGEMLKWGEMVEVGIAEYMRLHPDRFHRRVRRGIPPRFRWQVWKALVKVQDRELPQDYHALSTRDNAWTPSIEIDIARTFPDVKAFDSTQQQCLLRVLNAYASYNPDVGYCQGMNFVAGLLLMVSDCAEEESFGVLVCLMDHVGLAGFYTERLPLLRRYLRACDRLVAEMVPDLRDHFIREQVQPAVYLHQWFLTLFINCFPLSMVSIIWDVIICEGLPVILRIAISILQVLKDSLLSMHFEEIIKFFKMMRTYEDEEGELNAFRIGQLLMKHTEHVVIPDRVMEYLSRDPLADEDNNLDSDESWEADYSNGSWLQSLSRMFAWSPSRRRIGSTSSNNAPTTAAVQDNRHGYSGGSSANHTSTSSRAYAEPQAVTAATGQKSSGYAPARSAAAAAISSGSAAGASSSAAASGGAASSSLAASCGAASSGAAVSGSGGCAANANGGGSSGGGSAGGGSASGGSAVGGVAAAQGGGEIGHGPPPTQSTWVGPLDGGM